MSTIPVINFQVWLSICCLLTCTRHLLSFYSTLKHHIITLWRLRAAVLFLHMPSRILQHISPTPCSWITFNTVTVSTESKACSSSINARQTGFLYSFVFSTTSFYLFLLYFKPSKEWKTWSPSVLLSCNLKRFSNYYPVQQNLILEDYFATKALVCVGKSWCYICHISVMFC